MFLEALMLFDHPFIGLLCFCSAVATGGALISQAVYKRKEEALPTSASSHDCWGPGTVSEDPAERDVVDVQTAAYSDSVGY